MVILSGGEPTVHPDLLPLAECVAHHGLQLGLVTNGRRLADASLVDDLLRHNLTFVYVSLHGARASLHDAMVRTKAFEQTLRGIHQVAGRVQELTVNTVVTRDNLFELRQIVELLEPLPNIGVKFTFPQPKGAAFEHFDAVIPSLSEAAHYVADAISSAQARGSPVRFGFEGFPLCLMPRLESLHDDLLTRNIRSMMEPEDEDLFPVDDLLFTKLPQCENCENRAACPGVYREYIRRRGDEEIVGDAHAATSHIVVEQAHLREQAAHERRHWVRLSWACNNRCRFCLDRELSRASHRSEQDIGNDILQGRREGAERLILSGGEPTTHPKFISWIRFGKRAGYGWVQAITNGRMLSYPRFLAEAIRAGLDEITVSLHGHTASLHDQLVGVSGAFEQAVRGLRSALASKRLVVNVDIVVNAHNVDHLPEMLETFVGWGVREFDLLHLIPFGGAWESTSGDLFYDLAQHGDSIRRALEFCREQGVQVWLNRFPPPHAEGFEYLIQDPVKLQDEVRGRASSFEALVTGGPHLPCRDPKRCRLCYLQGLCDDFERFVALSRESFVPALRVDENVPKELLARLPKTDRLEIVAADPQSALALASTLHARSVSLRLDDYEDLSKYVDDGGCFGGMALREVVVSRSGQWKAALEGANTDLVVLLHRDLMPLFASFHECANRLILEQPTYHKLTTSLRNDVDLRSLFQTLGKAIRTRGIARCLSGLEPLKRWDWLEARFMRPDGTIDPQQLTRWYGRDRFFAKSLRCKDCRWNDDCVGMHINWLRAHGFAQLIPQH